LIHFKKRPRMQAQERVQSIRKAKKPLPEIFVENEANLRLRRENKMSTPLKDKTPDLKRIITDDSIDSGYGWNSLNSSSPQDSSLSGSASKNVFSPNLVDSLLSPILDIKTKMKGRPSFVDEPVLFRLKDLLTKEKVLAGLPTVIILSSIAFSIFVGLTGTNMNGKLSSIKYGTENSILKLQRELRIIDYDIMDENGIVLGGKHASIQFAYDKHLRAESRGEAVRDPDDDVEDPAPDNDVEVEDLVPVADDNTVVEDTQKNAVDVHSWEEDRIEAQEELDVEKELQMQLDEIQEKKRKFIAKLQESKKKQRAEMAENRRRDSDVPKAAKGGRDDKMPKNTAAKPSKTKVKNPLLRSANKLRQTRAVRTDL